MFVESNELEALALSAQSVRLYAYSLPLHMIVYMFVEYVVGTGKKLFSNIYVFLEEIGVILPVSFVMIMLMSGRGAWFALPVSFGILVCIALIYIMSWKNGKTFGEKRLLLPQGFGVGIGNELNFSIESVTEVQGMSRIAGMFCKEHGINGKKANAIAVCIEELGNNIIKHGFDDGKNHSIDLRILIKGNDLILRLRDDCKAFNPVERYKMQTESSEDITSNVGIRIAMKISKDVQYLNTPSTNNLIIHF